MNPTTSHIYGTTATANNHNLLPTPTMINQRVTTVLTTSNRNSGPQEYRNYLNDPNERANLDNSTCVTNILPNAYPVHPTSGGQDDPSSIELRFQQNSITSKQIQIKCEPRSTHHPRTQQEMERALHYIRCEDGDSEEYPAIYTYPEWQRQSTDNIIEVSHADIRGVLHPYPIDNQERRDTQNERHSRNPPLVWRDENNGSSILYFRLTSDDFVNGFKLFKIGIIKSKQDETITKKLIRDRELAKSMFRYTRIYQDEHGKYHRDEGSTVDSSIITEKYGDVSVDHVTPQFGPMGGKNILDVVFKGFKAADNEKLAFKICAEQFGWTHDISQFDSTGNTIHFPMPACDGLQADGVLAKLIVYYEQQKIHESSYLYHTHLDQLLNSYNMNKTNEDIAVQPHSSSRTSKKTSNKRRR